MIYHVESALVRSLRKLRIDGIWYIKWYIIYGMIYHVVSALVRSLIYIYDISNDLSFGTSNIINS